MNQTTELWTVIETRPLATLTIGIFARGNSDHATHYVEICPALGPRLSPLAGRSLDTLRAESPPQETILAVYQPGGGLLIRIDGHPLELAQDIADTIDELLGPLLESVVKVKNSLIDDAARDYRDNRNSKHIFLDLAYIEQFLTGEPVPVTRPRTAKIN